MERTQPTKNVKAEHQMLEKHFKNGMPHLSKRNACYINGQTKLTQRTFSFVQTTHAFA